MDASGIICSGFRVCRGNATLLSPQNLNSFVNDPTSLRIDWLNSYHTFRSAQHAIVPKHFLPSSRSLQAGLFDRLKQGLIEIQDLNDRGSVRETEIVVSELLRRYGFKTRLTRRSQDSGVDICAVRATPFSSDGYIKCIWEVANYSKAVPVDKVNQLTSALIRSQDIDWMVLVAFPRLTRRGFSAAFPVFMATRENTIQKLGKSLELIESDTFMKYVSLSCDNYIYEESEYDRRALRTLIENLYPFNIPYSRKILDQPGDLPL